MDPTSVFYGLMQDLVGRAHMDSEDPKWGSLFLAVEYYTDDMHQRETLMASYWSRLLVNCRKSNNLHKLLEQTSSRLDHMMSLKHSPPSSISKQCCGALYLTSSVMSYLLSHLGSDEFNDLLSLPATWPCIAKGRPSAGEEIINQLVVSLLTAVQNSSRMEEWMYDVVFFSSSLLIVLMSSQLFVGTPSVVSTVAAELNLPNPDIFIGSFSQNQPFLNYVYQLLEHHDSKPQQDYTIASKTLFTSLITLITSNISPQSGSLTSAMINGFQRRNSIVEGASRRLEAAVSAIDSPVLALLEGATENSSYMSDLFVTLGTILSVPIKALQAIILRVQERRDGAGQVTSGDDDSSGIVDFTCESLLGVAGRNSGLMTIPVAYTPTNPDGTESMSLETCPLVYILPAATVLSRRPLVERFCQLLLLLLFNKKCTHAELIAADVQLRTAGNSRAVCSTSSNKNLIRDLFCNIVDENMSRDVDVLDSHRPFSDSTMVYNFRSLATYLAKELVTSETATLLVYCMLQYNSTFLYSLMSSKGDFGGLLMISLLHRMYNQEEILRAHDTNMTEHIQSHKLANKMRKKMKSGRFHLMTTFGVTLEPLYVTVINTLILSQDRNFARYMFTLPQSNASASSAAPFVGVKMRSNVKDESWRTFDNVCWYKERNLSADVSLGDIAILCVLRTALLALFRQKNKYLLSNCLAILSNLGPHVINIHAYTAERVVTIIEKLGKRIIETEIKYMKRSRPKTEVTPPAASPNKKGQQTDLFRSSLDNSNEPLSASGIASYIEIMQNMQDTLRVVLVLVCRAIRPSRQIDNVQLIYALIRGGTKVCSIVEEPMIMDIAEGSSVDVHGLAHMAPFVDDGKDGKKSDGKGMKRFVNKIGSILSSVVKNRKRDAILPPVDAASPQLPIVYVPLLVKKGIKWMERRTNKASTMSAASSPQKNSSKNVGNVNTSPMVPAETTVGVRAVEANDEDCENNGGVHKSAQEAVDDLINWIGSESSMIYNDDDEETKSPTTQSEGQSTGSENNSHDEVKIAKTQIAAENVILTYEEGPTPQEFFVPYLWSVVMRSSPEMPVCLSQTSTVDIVSAGLIETMLVVAEEKKKKTSPQRTER